MTTALGLLFAVAGLLAALLVVIGSLWLGLRLAGLRQMGGPGRVLAWVVGKALRVRRAHALQSVRRAGWFDTAAGLDTAAVVDGMYRQLGRGLFELLWVAVHPRARLADFVELDPALVQRVSCGGRGTVIATAHTSNWDLVGCAAAEHVPLTIATKRLSIRFLDRLWQGLRRRRGLHQVEAGQIAARAGVALASGEVVAMLIDQAPERARATVAAPFLGQLALVDLAPALVAMRARAALLGVFPRRRADGVVVAEVCLALEPPPRPSRAWAEQAMRDLTAALDAHVRRHPTEWLWMHRRWKGADGAAAVAATEATPVAAAEPAA